MNSNGDVIDTSVTKPSFLDVPQGIMSNRLEVDYKATWTPGGFAATMAAATITPITPITNIAIADTPSMNDQPMPKALQAALRAAAARPIEDMPYLYTPPYRPNRRYWSNAGAESGILVHYRPPENLSVLRSTSEDQTMQISISMQG